MNGEASFSSPPSFPSSAISNGTGVAPSLTSSATSVARSPTTTRGNSSVGSATRTRAVFGYAASENSTTPVGVDSRSVVSMGELAVFGVKRTITSWRIPADIFPGCSYSTSNAPRCSTSSAITRNVEWP